MNFYFILLLVIFFIYKLLFSMGVGLIPDEAYYWGWSRHLDLSYYDQGPGIAYYIKLFTLLFGNTHFALKFAALFASLATLFFLYLTAKKLGYNKRELLWVCIFSLFIPAFFGGSIFIMHDSTLLLFWSLGIFSVVHFLKTRKPFFIYLLFISLSLGALSKHTMIFFAIGLILWLLVSKDEFSLFKNIHFYFAFLLALILIMPILYWNQKNDWENIDAILNLRSSGGANFKKATTGLYLTAQALAFSPIWFMGAIYLFSISIFQRIKNKNFQIEDSASRFIFINSIILPIFFLGMSFQKEIQGNWVFASYLSIILVLSKEENFTNKVYKYFIYVGVFVAITLNIFTFYSVPIVKFFNIKMETYYIPGLRHEGFAEIVLNLEKLKASKDPQAKIIANRYQDAAITSWFLKDKEFVSSINILQKNQYNHWESLEKGKNYFLVYIQENTCEKSFIFFQPYLKFMFDKMTEYPEQEIILDGRVIKRYQFWYLENYKKSWAGPVSEFLSKKFILELMPNLKGTNPFELKEKFAEEGMSMFTNYLDKKGETECSIF